MPWRERSPMDERVQFISDYQRQLFTMTELCDRYGISRKTGYAVVGRYEAEGAAGLSPRSSQPGCSPQATPEPIVEETRKASRAPAVAADDEEILDWDVVIPTPPPRSAGKIPVQLRYLGRGKPLPVEAPWAE